MAQPQFDVAVIGAGPGGYASAIRMAQLGLNVAIVEKENYGGVCLNVGCIPSKAMIYAAKLYQKIQHDAPELGIEVDNVRLRLEQTVAWKDKVVKKLTGGVEQLLKSNGATKFYGTARFKDKTTLEITDKDGKTSTLTAKHFLIATGSRTAELKGLEYDHAVVIDSTDALSLTTVPQKLVLVGGGYIGLELGILYANLGTQVTVVEMMPQLLSGMDKDVVDTLRRSMKKRKIEVYLESKVKTVQKSGGQATLVLETPDGDKTLDAIDKVLVAVGRKPNSDQLGLDKIGVKVNERGFITVDNQLRTSVSHIFAIGDVTSAPLLAHKASKEGMVAAEVIAGHTTEVLDYRALPSAVFTDPEIASVGLTEAAAQEQGRKIKTGKFPFAASGRALTMHDAEGFVKVISDAETDELLGVHMIGPEVSELIAEAALAIEMGATAEDLALTIHTHPTLPESLMEAAEAVEGRAIHIYESARGRSATGKKQPVKV